MKNINSKTLEYTTVNSACPTGDIVEGANSLSGVYQGSPKLSYIGEFMSPGNRGKLLRYSSIGSLLSKRSLSIARFVFKPGTYRVFPVEQAVVLSCVILSAFGSSIAYAQKLGVGGTGVDEASQLPICDKSLGTVALVEEKRSRIPASMRCRRRSGR